MSIAQGKRRAEDTKLLLQRYAATRDADLLDQLVRRLAPLARSMALRYGRTADSLDDLEQVANLGLVKAIKRFDPERGYAFSSFAVPTIAGEIKRAFRDTAWSAHVPRSTQELSGRVRDAGEAIEARLGRAPTVAEIAAAIGAGEEAVAEAMAAATALNTLSLDAPVGAEDGDLTLADHLGAHDAGYERLEDLAAIQAALPTLTAAQRDVLALRFGQDLPQSQIARRLGISQMHVSRLLRSGLDRLRAVAHHQSDPNPSQPIGRV